jgi:hypothetical protein
MKKVLAIIIIYTCVSQWTQAQVSSTAFRDFNANGMKDNSATFNKPFVEVVTDKGKIERGNATGSFAQDKDLP